LATLESFPSDWVIDNDFGSASIIPNLLVELPMNGGFGLELPAEKAQRVVLPPPS
jgi:hypothetical protein